MSTSLSRKRLKLVEEVVGNEDLLRKILLLLPAKQLTRLKCVSKQWFSIISDPFFCSIHTRCNPMPSVSGIYYSFSPWEKSEELKSLSLQQDNLSGLPMLTTLGSAGNVPSIIHACNGLYLLSYCMEMPYVVCNPTTKEFTLLPQHIAPACVQSDYTKLAKIAFDPSKSPHFKVVTIYECDTIYNFNFYDGEDVSKKDLIKYDGFCYEIDIFSSESGSWKRIHIPELSVGHPCDLAKVLWSGAIHWLTTIRFHVRFEVDAEKLISYPIPEDPCIVFLEDHFLYFGECCGRLFFVQWLSSKGLSVLEMDKHDCGWTLKYRVDVRPFVSHLLDKFPCWDLDLFIGCCELIENRKFSVLGIVKEYETNDLVLLLAIPGKIIAYSLTATTYKVLEEFPYNDNFCNNGYCFPFMATLAPLNCGSIL